MELTTGARLALATHHLSYVTLRIPPSCLTSCGGWPTAWAATITRKGGESARKQDRKKTQRKDQPSSARSRASRRMKRSRSAPMNSIWRVGPLRGKTWTIGYRPSANFVERQIADRNMRKRIVETFESLDLA